MKRILLSCITLLLSPSLFPAAAANPLNKIKAEAQQAASLHTQVTAATKPLTASASIASTQVTADLSGSPDSATQILVDVLIYLNYFKPPSAGNSQYNLTSLDAIPANAQIYLENK